ncbi:MAG: hypothetical protein NT048_05790 [Flavobacterium sp.]|nr:hypothetical protein [Flavobacterium sp.]
MKLSKENISQIDKALFKKFGVYYYDVRLEIVDHLASEIEQMEGDFEEILPVFLNKKSDFIKDTNLQLNNAGSRRSKIVLFKNIFSIKYLLTFIVVVFFSYNLISLKGKEWFLEYFDIMPIVVPAPISIFLFYEIFSSKRKSYILPFAGITNTILMTYLFIFIHIIRKADNFYCVSIFSFFMTLAIVYYYIYFFSIRQHFKENNLLKL